MKRSFFKAVPVGIAFFFATQANAQATSDIRDFYNNNLLTNDTVYFWVAMGTAHQYDFNQNNLSANQVTYKCSKTNVQLMSGASSNFCLYHNNDAGDPQSQCYIPSIMLSGTFVTNPGEYNTLLADFSPGTTTPGVSIVKYKFFDINNANDTATITLIYNATPVGIAESFVGSSLGEPYPNPASGEVTVPVLADGSMSVTNALGEIVYAETVSASNEKLVIHTAEWAEGIYIITLVDKNGVASNRKLIVE